MASRSDREALGRLVVIADLDYCGSTKRWLTVIQELAQFHMPGTFCVQVRIKNRTESDYLALAQQARDLVRNNLPLILNGSGEFALKLGYQGVHFPESRYRELRDYEGTELVTSIAAHDMATIKAIDDTDVSMVLYSPVFASTWKSNEKDVKGLRYLKEICSQSNAPIFALGGITPERCGACLELGVRGIAVLSGISGSLDCTLTTRKYLECISSGIS